MPMSSYAAANYFYWGGSTPGTNHERPGNTYEANVSSMSGQRWWPMLAADVGP